MRARDDIAQRLYLGQELELSISLIETGLALLQRSRSNNTAPFVFLILLSIGIERLMKIILHLHALKTTGSPLPERDLRDFGHAIIRLRQRVVDQCFTLEYLRGAGRPTRPRFHPA